MCLKTIFLSNLDCSIRLSSNDIDVLNGLAKKMGLTYEISDSELKDSDWKIQIELTSDLLSPSNENDFEPHFIEHGEPAKILNKGKQLVIWKDREFLLTRIGRRIIVKGHDGPIISELVRKAIRQIFTYELERKNGLRLHASAFEYNENGVALLGNKGAGKTTSLLSMIAYSDAKYIANDVLEVRPKNNNLLQINGWPTVCLVGRGTLHAIPRFSWLLPDEDDTYDSSKPKVAIELEDIEKVLGTELTTISRLDFVGYPKVNLMSTHTEIYTIENREGIKRLMEHVINEDKDHPDWLLLRSGSDRMNTQDMEWIFENVVFFEVVIGTDLQEASRAIRNLIDERISKNLYNVR